ncbi:hypothetical protein ACFX2I_026761 [Malus domestica]
MRTLYLSLKKMPKFKHRLLMVALLALVVSSGSWLSIFFLQLSEQKSHNLGLSAHLSPDSGPYHDWRLFAADFREMLQTFKIYVYPTNSNKSDPPSSSASFASFAAVFLPHLNPFNPKLGNYFSEHMIKISLHSSEHNEDNFLSLCSKSSIKNLEFRIRYTGFSNRFGFSIRRGKQNRRWGFMQGKVERFEKNRTNRKAMPETTAKKNKDIPVIAVEAVVEQAQYSLCFHSSPSRSDPNAITQSISSSLVNMNYCGPVSINAYVRQSGSQESGSL